MSLFSKSTLFTVGALSLSLAACQKGSPAANVAQNVDDATQKAVHQAELTSANHVTPCMAPVAGELGQFIKLPGENVLFDLGSSLQKTTTVFSDASCATAAVSIVEAGNYQLNDKVSDDTYQLNEHFDSVKVTPLTDAEATAMNVLLICGGTDWAKGVAKDVTATTGTDVIPGNCWTTTPRDVYDIIQITGSQIRFGLNENGLDKTASNKRPVRIDNNVVYSKP